MGKDLVRANAVEGQLEPVEGQREWLLGCDILLERELHHRPHLQHARMSSQTPVYVGVCDEIQGLNKS